MLVLSREAGSVLNLVKSDHIGVAIDRFPLVSPWRAFHQGRIVCKIEAEETFATTLNDCIRPRCQPQLDVNEPLSTEKPFSSLGYSHWI